MQCLGGVHTYLKRYLYINALELVENDLFDKISGEEAKKETPQPQKAPNAASYKPTQTNTPSKVETQKTPQNKPLNAEQALFLYGLTEQQKVWICQKFNIEDVKQLTSEQVEYVMAAVNRKRAANDNK